MGRVSAISIIVSLIKNIFFISAVLFRYLFNTLGYTRKWLKVSESFVS